MRRTLFLGLLLLITTGVWGASRYLPPPLRVHVPFEAAWGAVHQVLVDRGTGILEENRGQGSLVSNYAEFISGSLTNQYLAKIGEPPANVDGYWLKAEFRVEVQVDIVDVKETLVTADASIRALKRDFFGKETWVEIPSNGTREEDFLNEFGRVLFGESFSIKSPKKGLWEREPSRVPELERKLPRTVTPGVP